MSDRQIRRLAANGDLAARRVGDRWIVSADAVRQRVRSEPLPGRPLSAETAWALIAVVGSVIDPERSPDPFAAVGDRRVRYRLRVLLADAPPVEQWDRWLRHRADALRVWVHPGAVDRLADDDRVHPAAPASAAGVGIGAGDSGRFYVDGRVVEPLLADYRARPDDDGAVVLMVVPPAVADAALGSPGDPVSPAAALVDLLGSSDARERHAAATALEDARRELVGAADQGSPA